MQDKPHIALLPGLDGTGELFAPLIPWLQAHFQIHKVRYSNETSFDECLDSAANQLPRGEALSLVAESFSGPVAIALLATKNPDFQASVLSATFCKTPLPLLTGISGYLPEVLFSSNPASRALMDLFVTGNDAQQEVRDKARDLLEKITPAQFQNRIGIVNEVDVTTQLGEIDLPLLYIQATRDRIVLADSGAEIAKYAKNLKIARVEGAHMILQTRPESCASLIIDHLTKNRRR